MLHTTDDGTFKVGQVWAYHTRPGEEESKLIVLRTEADEAQGEIVHISVRGIRMTTAQGGVVMGIAHLPFSEEALRRSVTDLVKQNAPLPHFEEGYRQWREAFDAGGAGLWTIPVAEVVAAMEAAVRPG